MPRPLAERGCLLRAEAAHIRAELTAINQAMSVVYADLRSVEETVRALPAGACCADQLAQRRRLLHDWRRLLQQHACMEAVQENARAPAGVPCGDVATPGRPHNSSAPAGA